MSTDGSWAKEIPLTGAPMPPPTIRLTERLCDIMQHIEEKLAQPRKTRLVRIGSHYVNPAMVTFVGISAYGSKIAIATVLSGRDLEIEVPAGSTPEQSAQILLDIVELLQS